MVKQPSMLHTTVARLLKPPAQPGAAAIISTASTTTSATTADSRSVGGVSGGSRELRSVEAGGDRVQRRQLHAALETTSSSSGGSYNVTELHSEAVMAAVDSLSASLCGLRAQFGEVWFIEEQDLLALALNGRYVRHVAQLSCPTDGEAAVAA